MKNALIRIISTDIQSINLSMNRLINSEIEFHFASVKYIFFSTPNIYRNIISKKLFDVSMSSNYRNKLLTATHFHYFYSLNNN